MTESSHPTSTAGTDQQTGRTIETRWCCQFHLKLWLAAFKEFFPRRAHNARQAATLLGGLDVKDKALVSTLPGRCDGLSEADPLFNDRALAHFESDRLTLIHTQRLMPDAVDLFLHQFPVGCNVHIGLDKVLVSHLLEDETYYAPDQGIPDYIPAIIEQQRQRQLGYSQPTMADSERFHDGFMLPALYAHLFQKWGWAYAPLETPSVVADMVRIGAPLLQLGSLVDGDIGTVDCYCVPTTIYRPAVRDELAFNVTRFAREQAKPVLLLNNRPMQLRRAGKTFTSLGLLVVDGQVHDFFVPARPASFADVLVACTCFTAGAAAALEDDGAALFNEIWKLTLANMESPPPEPFQLHYVSMPDGWQLPQWACLAPQSEAEAAEESPSQG